MADYINRDEAIKVVGKYFETTLGLNSDICVDGIRSISAADVRPVVYGEWVKDDVGLCVCSVCGKVAPYDAQADVVEYWPSLNFCYNCGADMRR